MLANQPLDVEERPVPEPGPGQVRIKVHACGICHSDRFVTGQLWPGLELPRVPGHEIAGVVDATGDADIAFFAGAETMTETGSLSPQTLARRKVRRRPTRRPS